MITLTQFLAYLAVISYCFFMGRELLRMFVAQWKSRNNTTFFDHVVDWLSFSLIFWLASIVYQTTKIFSQHFHIMGL